MRLRAQVLAVGLATLVVPVLGWQGVRQLHASLQATRADAQTLAVANLRVALAGADALQARLARGAVAADPRDWYAETSRWPLFVDGYADDWRELAGRPTRYSAADAASASSAAGSFVDVDGVSFGSGTDSTLALRVARRSGRLYLFVRVRDDTPVRHVPPRPPIDAGENERLDPRTLRANGDAVQVFVRTPDGELAHALLSVIAPGPVAVVRAVETPGADDRLPRWRAEWVDDARGYQLEIELPLPPSGSHVGIAAIDVDRPGGGRDAWVGTASPAAMTDADGEAVGGRLFHESPAARATLLPWVPPGTRARLYDRAGRLVADVDALYAPLPEGDEPPPSLASGLLDAILFRLFAWFAAGDLPLFPETEKTRQPLSLDAGRRADARADDPPTRRYVTVDNDRVLGTLVPIGTGGRTVPAPAGTARPDRATRPGVADGDPSGTPDANPLGYLLFESNEEHASIATGSRLARLFAGLLLASLLVATLLFAWATRLSLRIRRLSREASRAVDADGRVARLAGSEARDEIGELSRDLSALLARSAAYTRYLETLSSRLSHELGTPLSVVRTSLENVDRKRLDTESATLLARAGGGAERLGAIVRALIDSTRLEQSVQHASFAPLELRGWLEEAAAEYALVHPGHRFPVTSAPESEDGAGLPRHVRVHGSATLLRQALDKLVDNARDFATSPSIALVLGLDDDGGRARITLAVANRGPAIGASAHAAVFEPAFSTRPGAPAPGAPAHGGLGLHLVRLIAEAHGGEAFAEDRRDGVMIGLRLPSDVTGRVASPASRRRDAPR